MLKIFYVFITCLTCVYVHICTICLRGTHGRLELIASVLSFLNKVKIKIKWYGFFSNNVVCATSKGSDRPTHTSDQSLCKLPEYNMSVKLFTKDHFELLSLKGGCPGSSESTLVKMPHCWKSHVAAHFNWHNMWENCSVNI